MAQIPNLNALTVGDGLSNYLNIDTINKIIQILNGAKLQMYSDGGATPTLQLSGGTICAAQSATAPAIANAGTITTAGVGVARVSPAGAVTGIILQPGTVPGQELTIINEAIAANTITFAASGTSNVADGTSDVIAGVAARQFVWDSVTALWYKTV